MKKSVKLALAFVALAGAAGAVAHAADKGGRGAPGARFERADADKSGDVSFEEFAAVMDGRVGWADKDGDGKMSVGEIAAEIERMRAERMAKRLVERFDADGDGTLSKAEIDDQQKKMFARLDRNDDGKLGRKEMRRAGRGGDDWDGHRKHRH